MEMVKYWKHKESVEAKVTEIDGVICMQMDGEKYAFPGFPRGHLLFGSLSKLKHEIKNQIFNDSWSKLEAGISDKEVIEYIGGEALVNVLRILEEQKFDLVPPSRMCPPVRELNRAWTEVSPHTWRLRDLICFILQEDDSYRFRFQWIASYMPTFLFRFVDPIKCFSYALTWLENAEVIGDMKERQRLFKRIMVLVLRDKRFANGFRKLFREIRWSEVKLTKADKYFFRGKYFKVDLDKFDY